MATILVGDTVKATEKVWGRKAPSGPYRKSKGKPLIRNKGFSFVVTKLARKKGSKVTYAKTNKGTWYSVPKLAVKHVLTPVPGRKVTTPWGKKPNNNTYWQARGHHTGADYAANQGEKIRAVRAGTVYRYWDNVLGNVALLFADNGLTYWSCHTSKYLVANNTKVKAGQYVAEVGQTGTGAMGPHLHLEVRKGHSNSWAGADFNPIGTW